jgi:hypothetical protein
MYITPAHLTQTATFFGLVNVQHRGHLLNVAGRTRIPRSDSQPGQDRSTTRPSEKYWWKAYQESTQTQCIANLGMTCLRNLRLSQKHRRR